VIGDRPGEQVLADAPQAGEFVAAGLARLEVRLDPAPVFRVALTVEILKQWLSLFTPGWHLCC
jgi:hypothetical protein